MIERIKYGGIDNPFNYSEFTCDTILDLNNLPTNKEKGINNLETCSIGSKAIVIENRSQYILNGHNQWVLLKDYKNVGGGSNLEIDETLTLSGYAADAKIVGDKINTINETLDNTNEKVESIQDTTEKLLNDSTRHVHTNMQSLMEITAADITSLHRTFPQKIYEIEHSLSDYATKEEVAQTTEKVAQLDSSVSSLNRKTIKFRHGKGTFNASATGTNIVWKYGSQEIQGESCIFDVKSDNGLIVIEFDEITKITINNDALNKLCLSDLGGKITTALSLTNCFQITGDLSDLGGKITTTLDLDSCSQITGDLSDLGGKITNILSLYNCSQITGDLSDLGGKITTTLSLNNCSQITGDLSDLGGKITTSLGLYNCSQITGDLSDLGGKITTILSLNNCSQITGDLSDLGGKITNILSLNNCSQITGVYSGTKYPTRFVVSNTAITANDMDQNLINFSNSTIKNGTFTATNMTRTAASDDAITTLVANGWTVSGLTKVEV